jgi:cytosine/adenosine deaminase-related metal-dependent hydrolase
VREAGGFSCVSANDLTDPALSELHDRVKGASRLLAVHVSESPEYRSISLGRTGTGDVDRVLRFLRPDFVVHLTDAVPGELDRLAAAGMAAVVCPRIQGVMGLGVPRFDLMMERGMTVALGTDNLFLSSPDMLREVDYSSRVIRALRKEPRFPSAVQMLQMITINAAKVLGMDADIGSLEVGKRADIVAFDSASLNLRPVRDPVATLVNRGESGDIMAVFHEGALVRGGFETA